jgi:hypothetical protein
MIGGMDQEPRPAHASPPPPATPPSQVTPAAHLLGYGQPPEPLIRVGEYLVYFTAAAIVCGALLVALNWTVRVKQFYVDFALKVPRSTQLLMDVSDATFGCYGWVLLAVVPFVAPFLLARLRPPTRRWVATLVILLMAAFLLFAVFAVFEPMLTLMRQISGKP